MARKLQDLYIELRTQTKYIVYYNLTRSAPIEVNLQPKSIAIGFESKL